MRKGTISNTSNKNGTRVEIYNMTEDDKNTKINEIRNNEIKRVNLAAT